MYANSIRVEPAFEGEGSVCFYGKNNEALSRVTQKIAKNGYSNSGRNFTRRCGYTAVYRTSNRVYTFTIDDKRIGLIEEDGTGIYFTPYSTLTGFKIKDPVRFDIKFEDFDKYNELNYRSGTDLIFSVQGGLYSINDDSQLIQILSTQKTYVVEQTSAVATGTQITMGIDLHQSENKYRDYNQYAGHDVTGFLNMLKAQSSSITMDYRQFMDMVYIFTQPENMYPDNNHGDLRNLSNWIDQKLAEIQKSRPADNITLVDVSIQVTALYYYKLPPYHVDKRHQNVTVEFDLLTMSYKGNPKIANLVGVNDFSKSVFFNGRLLIFHENTIYFSSIYDPYQFDGSSVTDNGILNKASAGSLNLIKFYNLNGGITNVISISDYIILTTVDNTYLISNNVNSPLGFAVSIVSNEGAMPNGLLILGHEIYKLSSHGIKKLVNYQYYSQIQEVEATLYQPHIYHYPHTNLSYSHYKNEKYLYTLREDGIVFCHTPIPVSLTTEYSYYILSSRFDSKYFEVTQIGRNFKSGICKIRRRWGDDRDNILFMYDNFDFNNDNYSPYNIYGVGDLDNYFFLDLGVCDHTTLFSNSIITNDYIVDYTAQTLTLNLLSFLVNNKLSMFNDNAVIKIGDMIRINNQFDFPVISIDDFVITLDITQGLMNVVFNKRLKAGANIAFNGKLYGEIQQQQLDILKNVYKEGEPITDELKMVYDDHNGHLQMEPFDLYAKHDPNPNGQDPDQPPIPYKPYKLGGCYFAVGLPFETSLNIHTNALDIGATVSKMTIKTLLTENFEIWTLLNELDYATPVHINSRNISMSQISQEADVTNSMGSLKDFSNVEFRAYQGEFFCLLSFVLHF